MLLIIITYASIEYHFLFSDLYFFRVSVSCVLGCSHLAMLQRVIFNSDSPLSTFSAIVLYMNTTTLSVMPCWRINPGFYAY